jgi:hypothetical protein
LTFAGQIIETGTTSYRLAHARRQRARAAGGVQRSSRALASSFSRAPAHRCQ